MHFRATLSVFKKSVILYNEIDESRDFEAKYFLSMV